MALKRPLLFETHMLIMVLEKESIIFYLSRIYLKNIIMGAAILKYISAKFN